MIEISGYMKSLSAMLKALAASIELSGLKGQQKDLYYRLTANKKMDAEDRLKVLFNHISELREIDDKMKRNETIMKESISEAISLLLDTIDTISNDTPTTLIDSLSKTIDSIITFVSSNTFIASHLIGLSPRIIAAADKNMTNYPNLSEHLRGLADCLYINLKTHSKI